MDDTELNTQWLNWSFASEYSLSELYHELVRRNMIIPLWSTL